MDRRRKLAAALLALAGCQAPTTSDDSPGGSASDPARMVATGLPAPAASVVPAAATARLVEVSNDLVDFSYAYPANAAAIPALGELLDAEMARQRARVLAGAREARRDAAANGYPFNRFGFWVDWRTVTDLPGWLSLSAEVGTFEGGAHPNHGFDTILWDRKAGLRRAPPDLFTSRQALSDAIRAPFCRALDAQRRKKRGGDGRLDGGVSEFDECIDPLDATLILGSANARAFDRLGILVPPYLAGPYAEGSYEVTLPVTQAVLTAVRPEFRTAFVTARN